MNVRQNQPSPPLRHSAAKWSLLDVLCSRRGAEKQGMQRMIKHGLASVGFMILLPGCLLMPHYETVVRKVNGRVVDACGKPVSGATISYHLRSGHKLGSTTSDTLGKFTLGPFRQWFYLVYVGSPGVCPVPYLLLSDPAHPDVLSVTHEGAKAVYCRGSRNDYEARFKQRLNSQLERFSKLRWTGRSNEPDLKITPIMRDSLPQWKAFRHPTAQLIP